MKHSATTPAIASAIERPIHHGVCRPFGGGRRKSLSRRFADILKGRTAIAYDPQDLTTLFQDAQGTLPVYRPGTGLVDPPVGLMLDKSQGLVLGPELVTNQTFDADVSGWFVGSNITATQDAGEALVTFAGSISGTANNHFRIDTNIPSYGKTFKISFDATYVSTLGNLFVGVAYQSGLTISPASNGGVKTRYELYVRNVVPDQYGVVTFAGGVGSVWRIDNVSCREIKGYHAYQTTTTARPTLSGRYNLLTATETLATQSVTTVAGIHTLRFEGAGTITLSGTATGGPYSAGTHTITCTAGTLTCTVAGSVTRADLRVKRDGSSLPAYQSVTNANTYNTAGFPLYLKRDRADDDLIVQAPAITGAWAHGTIDGPVIGTVAIPAGEYHPFGTYLAHGLPDCTQWIAIDGTLSASEQAVFERYVYSKARQLIDVPQFGGVSNIRYWFRNRTDITSIDSADWDTSNVITPNFLLFTCHNLAIIDVSGWDTSKFTTLTALFYECSKLAEADVSGWDTSNCTEAVSTFISCGVIPSLDISGWDCSKITSFASFANTCLALATVTVGGAFDNTPCTNFVNAFINTNLNQVSIDAILVSINNAGTSNGTFDQSGGSAPSATGQAAITAMRSRGWTVTVTGGF